MAEETNENNREGRVDRGAPRLLERDRQIVGAVAIARYLTTEQVHRLLYQGRHESVPRKRLMALAGLHGRRSFTPPYLRRLTYRTHSGTVVVCWALTDAGYALAQEVLGRDHRFAGRDVGAAFLEHAATLSDLFVELALAHLTRDGRLAELPFRWAPIDTVRLPWTQYDAHASKTRDRLLVPDAVLELPAERRRIFIECEMGTHSIVAASDEKAGATLAKAERWEEFFTGHADLGRRATFYEAAYPDRATPEVLFLVRTASRRASVNDALQRWRAGRGAATFRMHAQTLADVVHELTKMAAAAPAAAAPPNPPVECLQVTPEEAHALREFYQHALKALAPHGLSAELRALALRARPVLLRLEVNPNRSTL